jgi:tRNA wybutosine-synthesizing protein 3
MDPFEQRKNEILSKEDKSSIGRWDEKIKCLCEGINSFEEYYTTSSCSGRIVLMIDQDRKESDLFKFVSHGLVEGLWKEIGKLDLKENIKFKQEPCILHVACKDLESAEKLLNLGREAGWKKSGILSLGKNVIVELNSTEKLEFPVASKRKLLVNEDFVREVEEISNEHLQRTWKKIEKLENSLD